MYAVMTRFRCICAVDHLTTANALPSLHFYLPIYCTTSSLQCFSRQTAHDTPTTYPSDRRVASTGSCTELCPLFLTTSTLHYTWFQACAALSTRADHLDSHIADRPSNDNTSFQLPTSLRHAHSRRFLTSTLPSEALP